jgi:ABC-2 type transport system ATP-binding protein
VTRPVVVVSGLTHRYGDREALSDISLEVREGELFGLLGPNGGGKTTLLHVLSTLLRPTAGTARVEGHDTVESSAAVRARIGVVFQHPALDVYLTPRENLRHHGHLHGMRGPRLAEAIAAGLAELGVAERADDRVKTLSGGTRRRVELAQGFLHDPAVVLLDEPTVGLDPRGRRDFWDRIAALRRSRGAAVIVATHLMDEAERCDRIAILDRGRVVATGTPDALKSEIRGDVIALEAADPDALAASVAERFGGEVVVVDGTVRIERADGPALVPRLAEAFPGSIRSITVGKPTLEDVFLHRTGRPFLEPVPAGEGHP